MNRLFRLAAAAIAALSLAGCVGESIWDSDEAVARATYVPPGPATVTVITSTNTRMDSGAHTGLLIDGAQRLLFDPAGSWFNPGIPERNDVLFGMTPEYLDLYLAFQSNGVFEVTMQTVEVSPAVAQQLSQVVQSYGAVSPSQCTRSISTILSNTPGFEAVSPTWFPTALLNDMANVPGVQTRIVEGTLGDQEDLTERPVLEQIAAQGQ
ncbi:hypothetical protein [Gymnodinialimonas sp.]